MQITKNRILILFIGLSITIICCRKKEVADVTIKYEILLLNSSRPCAIIYQSVSSGGVDTIRNFANLSYHYSFIIPSNKQKAEYVLKAFCPQHPTSCVLQTLTLRIFEDDKMVAEQIHSGPATFYSSTTIVSAELPSRTKYDN